MAATQTIIDDFKDNSLSATIWNLPAWGGAQIAENNNQLELTTTLASGYYGIDTPRSHDLTGSYAFAKSNGATSSSITSFEFYFLVNADDTGNNQLSWRFSPSDDVVQAYKKVGGVSTLLANITGGYTSFGDGYVRFRELNGITYWDYALSTGRGLQWLNLWSEANPLTITSVKMGFMVGTYAAEASTAVARFGCLNKITRKLR